MPPVPGFKKYEASIIISRLPKPIKALDFFRFIFVDGKLGA